MICSCGRSAVHKVGTEPKCFVCSLVGINVGVVEQEQDMCNCGYPGTQYKTMTGHGPKCPIQIKAMRDAFVNADTRLVWTPTSQKQGRTPPKEGSRG